MLKSTQLTITPLPEYCTVPLLHKSNVRRKPHNLSQQRDLYLAAEHWAVSRPSTEVIITLAASSRKQ